MPDSLADLKTLHVEMGRHLLGGTMQVFYLNQGLAARGMESAVVCPRQSELYLKCQEEGITVFPVHYGGDMDLRLIFALRRIIREYRPDITHIHSRRGGDTLGLMAAKWAHCGRIVVSRRVDHPLARSGWNKLRYEKWPDRTVAVSEGIRQAMIQGGIDGNKVTVVHSGIEAALYQTHDDRIEVRNELGIGHDRLVLAVIGQLIERKGHRFLMEALPAIREKHAKVELLFLGEGRLEEDLRAECKRKGIVDQVHFAGFRRDVGRVLRAVDVLVHPATMEGFANAVLQGMAAEVPVVSSAVGGMPESVRDGENGFLVPPSNPQALADAVIRLLDSPALRAEFGQRGRIIVETEFSSEAMVEGLLRVYRDLVGRRPPAGQ